METPCAEASAPSPAARPREGTYDVRVAAKAIARELGPEIMRGLHRGNRWLDALACGGVWLVVIVLFHLLGHLPIGPIWMALFILQGFALHALAFCAHDLFVHRRVGGERLADVLANVCLVPLLLPATGYRANHLDHHRFLGTSRDTGEAYKEDFDRRWIKLLFLLAPGVVLVVARVFRRPSTPKPMLPVRGEAITRALRRERRLLAAFVVLTIAAAIVWPRAVLLGYVAPLFIVFPCVTALRVILEHGEMNPENPYHSSICYRGGPLSRLLFFWSAGEYHLIHHLFPGIPVYRMREAGRVIVPLLVKNGVIVRTSFASILWSWFVDNRRHATLWSA